EAPQPGSAKDTSDWLQTIPPSERQRARAAMDANVRLMAGYVEPNPRIGEDCLVLNVWTPSTGPQKRPVMVWLHGGGFKIGSGGAPWFDGSHLAARHDIVVVTLNHRLNVLGYLY